MRRTIGTIAIGALALAACGGSSGKAASTTTTAAVVTTTTPSFVPSAAICPTHGPSELSGDDIAKVGHLSREQLTACATWFMSQPTTTTTEAPTTSTAPPMVVYTVTGGHVGITYSDPSDGTIQQVTVNGPWTKSWPINGDHTFYSVSVQNQIDTSGPNSCTVTVDGQVKSTHSASGFNIADCQG